MLSPRELPASKPALAVVAVVVLALVAGGAYALGLVGGQPTALDQVPDDADGVARIDPAILDDPSSRSLLESGVEAAGFGSVAVADTLDSLESRSGLSMAAVDDVLVFGRYGATGDVDVRYVGAVVHADWPGEAVRDALADAMGMSYEETTYAGHTVYQPAGGVTTPAPTVAVLDDGEFVFGTPLTVDDTLAVANGEADALGGSVRHALADAGDGLVTAAAELPRERVAEFDDRTGGLTRLGSIRVVAGSYDTTDDSVSLTLRLRADGTEAARDVTDVTRGGLAIVASDVENETVATLLGDVAVERESRDVTMALETTAAELRAITRHYGVGGE